MSTWPGRPRQRSHAPGVPAENESRLRDVLVPGRQIRVRRSRLVRYLYKTFTWVAARRASNQVMDEKRGGNHMRQALRTTNHGDGGMLQRIPLAAFLAVLGVAEAAFLLGLVAMLSWQEWVLVILVTTALAGGTV